MRKDRNAFLFQCRDQAVVVGTVLIVHKFMGDLADLFKLFGWSHTGNVFFIVLCVNHVLQGSYTHHVKFIQIRCSDA